MAIDPAGAIEHERRLDEVLGAYFEAIEAGQPIDPRALIGNTGNQGGTFDLGTDDNWLAIIRVFRGIF